MPDSGLTFALFSVVMTIRIRIARSATENLKTLATEAVQGATLTGYGFLLAMVWVLWAARLH